MTSRERRTQRALDAISAALGYPGAFKKSVMPYMALASWLVSSPNATPWYYLVEIGLVSRTVGNPNVRTSGIAWLAEHGRARALAKLHMLDVLTSARVDAYYPNPWVPDPSESWRAERARAWNVRVNSFLDEVRRALEDPGLSKAVKVALKRIEVETMLYALGI